jgi:predicted nucleotidyltransferase
MPASQPRIADEQIVQVIAALAPFQPAVIYLFGSFGTPAQHPESDVDLAFLPTISSTALDCFRIGNDLAEQLGNPVDIVDLKHASTVLAKEVFLTGTPLFTGNPAIQQEFEMRTLSDYARLNEERQPVLNS